MNKEVFLILNSFNIISPYIIIINTDTFLIRKMQEEPQKSRNFKN